MTSEEVPGLRSPCRRRGPGSRCCWCSIVVARSASFPFPRSRL